MTLEKHAGYVKPMKGRLARSARVANDQCCPGCRVDFEVGDQAEIVRIRYSGEDGSYVQPRRVHTKCIGKVDVA
jgi:hypothetical protein